MTREKSRTARSQTPLPPAADSPPSPALPEAFFHDPKHGITIYQGDCLQVLAALPAESVDLIFADPPYFLSNSGITCHAGRMVSVNKGEWDRSRGPDGNHQFNRAWLAACQRLLKPNGAVWVSGTAHGIHSVGFAMQQLGMKLLNDITWVKPNPPPNLSCRYFTHATETIIWAAKSRKSRHTFNYKLMKEFNRGRQMKSVWTLPAPDREEKRFGKHPTQKPLALLERILLASSHQGDLVLDPFLGSGTTAVAALRLQRRLWGIERDTGSLRLSLTRTTAELLRVQVMVWSFSLDLRGLFVDRSEPRPREHPMPPRVHVVYREQKYFFVGADPREIIFTIEAGSLEEAWQQFLASAKGAERVLSVVKTQTEIYLTQ